MFLLSIGAFFSVLESLHKFDLSMYLLKHHDAFFNICIVNFYEYEISISLAQMRV